MTRTYPSGYKVILDENRPRSTNIMTVDIKPYVWQHHYAAKNSKCNGKALATLANHAHTYTHVHVCLIKHTHCFNLLNFAGMDCPKIDYAHEATGFPTWHRQFVAFACDGATPNRKFFKMHGNGSKLIYKTPNIYSDDPGGEIYFFADVPHLLKTTRNCWSNSFAHLWSRALWVGDIIISIECI